MAESTIRIVTLNTWKNEGQMERRLPLIADGLKALNADIVLLQECFRCEGTGDDTAGSVARLLGYECNYAPSREKFREHCGESVLSESGLAILSRFGCIDSWYLKLPSSPHGGERIAFFCELELDGTRIGIMCIHFSHVRTEERIRGEQIDCSLKALSGLARRMPCVLAGDFNCSPEDAEIREARVGVGSFVNVLPSLKVFEPTSPLPVRSGRVGRQIDQIWILKENNQFKGTRLKVIDGGVCLTECDNKSKLYPSDHAGVWVDLQLIPHH